MSNEQLRRNQAAWQAQQPLYTDSKPARTGRYIPGSNELDADPSAGLDRAYLWVRIAGSRAETRAINAINNAVANTPCIVGYNQAGSLVAYDVDFSEDNVAALGENLAGLRTPDKNKQTDNTPKRYDLLAGGRVLPSSLGGLYVYVEEYIPGGLDNGIDVDLSADEPGSTNQHRWELLYLDPTGVPTVEALTAHTIASNAGLMVSEARDYVLPDGSLRLAAVSLSNGETSITMGTSRFVDLRRHHEREGSGGGVQSVVAGTNVTVDNTDPANPIVSATGGGGGGGTGSAWLGSVLYEATLASDGLFDIQESDLVSGAGTFASYDKIEIIVDNARSTRTGSTNDDVRLFYGTGGGALDTTVANYGYQTVIAAGALAAGGQNDDAYIAAVVADDSDANYNAMFKIEIYNPGSANWKRAWSVNDARFDPGAGTNHQVRVYSHEWENTGVIDRIGLQTVLGGSNFFESDTSIRIIGYKNLPVGGGSAVYRTDNVSNPPTAAQLTTAFGAPASVGAGFLGVLNDNGAGTNEYVVWSDGSDFWYAAGTKAT